MKGVAITAANQETIRAITVTEKIVAVYSPVPDLAVAIGKKALAENITLREAAVALGHVTGEEFDVLVRPEEMTRPGVTLPGGG